MIDIYWSADSQSDYESNIDYLLTKWTLQDAEEFVLKVEAILKLLSSGTVKFQSAKYRGLYTCVVCKQISLYYRETAHHEIELVRFWNNSKDESNIGIEK